MKRQPLCKVCRQPYVKMHSLQTICTAMACILEKIQTTKDKKLAKDAKTARKTLKDGRQAMKSSKTLLTEALGRTQDAVNAFRRHQDRDAGYGCISCGKMPSQGGDFHAGHYHGRKAYPAKRFMPDNIHLQCYACNRPNSGGVQPTFRRNLIERIGLARVEAVEADCPPAKYTMEHAARIQAEYKLKLKDIT